MAKLETFDGKVSNWHGLWKNGKGYYSSTRINIAALKSYKGAIRIQMYNNKYYVPDGKWPKFNFRIIDADTADAQTLEIDAYKQVKSGYAETQTVVPIKAAIEVARQLVHDHEYGYSIDDLVMEVESFMKDVSVQAIILDE